MVHLNHQCALLCLIPAAAQPVVEPACRRSSACIMNLLPSRGYPTFHQGFLQGTMLVIEIPATGLLPDVVAIFLQCPSQSIAAFRPAARTGALIPLLMLVNQCTQLFVPGIAGS